MKELNQRDVNEKFQEFKSYSKADADKVMDNLDKIQNIASSGTLRKYLDDIKLYFQMLGDVFAGRYKKAPVGTIAAIIGTLLYILSPVDLILDFIPVIGYLDDAAVLGLCLNFTKYDVEEYKKDMGIE
ncbi:MAG: DUF1232 domain-containing protein [Treponema sp.]|nr:DUF1232 domain-containing protein [Treponema sp.]